MTVLLWLAAVVLVLIGIAGVISPGLPGTPLVFLGLLLAAYIDNFTRVDWWPTLTLLGILTVLSLGMDILATALGAQRAGASGKALWGAALGTIIGAFFGIFGLILGPFVGAAVGQFTSQRDVLQAGRVGVATWIGMLIGVALKIATIFAMLGIFVTAYFI